MSRVWKLLLWLLLAISPAVARGAGSASDQKASPPDDSIVEMDKMIVSVAGYHWRYAKSEHFEILSDYPDDDFVTRIVQIAELGIGPWEKNLPIYRSNRELPAKIIVIENNGIGRFFTAIGITGDNVNPDKKIPGMRNIIWAERANNAEQLILICTITRQYMNSSESREDKAAAYGVNLMDNYLNNSLSEKKILFFAIGNHLWLINGYGSPERNRNTITIDRFRPGAEIRSLKYWATDDYENKLTEYGWDWSHTLLDKLPLVKLQDVVENTEFLFQLPTRKSSVEDAQKLISLQREATDFSYYCAFGPKPETRGAFENLMRYGAKRIPITEEIFRRYFGKNYEEFSNEMDHYYKISTKDKEYVSSWGNPKMVIDHFKKIPKIAWTDATRNQSARIISDWFFLNKRPDIARKTLDLTKAYIPYVSNDPEFCAAWGLSEMQYGDKATALSLLETAASAKVARPEVYRSLSRLYLENILASKGKDYKLDSAELQKVFDPLIATLKLWQRNPQTYLGIFELAQHTNVPFPKELWKTIANNCIQQFPDNFEMLNQLVPLLMQNGLADEATRLLDATEKCPLTTKEQQQLERLKTMAYHPLP